MECGSPAPAFAVMASRKPQQRQPGCRTPQNVLDQIERKPRHHRENAYEGTSRTPLQTVSAAIGLSRFSSKIPIVRRLRRARQDQGTALGSNSESRSESGLRHALAAAHLF